MSKRPIDIVIIGGGHNGLVAACYLAKAGLSTVVLERREGVFQRDFVHVRTTDAAQAHRFLLGIFRNDIVAHAALGEEQVARRVGLAHEVDHAHRGIRRMRVQPGPSRPG